MDIIDQVIEQQDSEGMLRRALERIIQLYTDKSHFIYELLQNAEDAGATVVKFVQFDDRLEVLHNGKPFTVANLQGLCDIGKSDKGENLNQIGEFGVGFKSVFGICEFVKLYSVPEHYKGNDCPNTEPFAVEIIDFTHPKKIEQLALPTEYTTKFVLPYCAGKTFSGFKTEDDLRDTIAKRLKDLGITTLLFMKHLTEISYEIKIDANKVSGTYILESEDLSNTCKYVSAIGESKKSNGQTQGEEIVSYLKFLKLIDNDSPRTVDIAFPVVKKDNGDYECIKSKSPFVSVYFPTETESKVDFIVQGPYRTTPNRSSIPAADPDNICFAQKTTELLRESLAELKRLKILNMSFIRCLPLDKSVFFSYKLFYPLYTAIADMLTEEEYLPCKNGGYVSAKKARLARREDIAELFSDKLLSELINDNSSYYWLPTNITENNKEYNYDKLYKYLTGELKVEVIRPESLRLLFNRNKDFLIQRNNDWLAGLYNLLSSIPAEFSKGSAGSNYLSCEIIKTSSGELVSPYKKTDARSFMPNVFLPADRDDVLNINFVDMSLYQRCRKFFDDVVCIQKPNEYQFFIEYIKKVYSNPAALDLKKHIKDIKLFIKYKNHPEYSDEMKEIMRNYLVLRCKTVNGAKFVNPYLASVYIPKSDDGIDVEAYLSNLGLKVYFVDAEFYSSHGIAIQQLYELAVIKTIITGDAVPWGNNVFEQFSLTSLKEVLKYISTHPKAPDAIIKSQIIFKILQKNESKLADTSYLDGYSETPSKTALIVRYLTGDMYFEWNGKWLFTDTNDLVSQKAITKRALNPSIYGKLLRDSKLYELLCFKESELDEQEKAEKEYDAIPQDKRDLYFEIELRRRYGITPKDIHTYVTPQPPGEGEPLEQAYDFPIVKVKNWMTLKKHATEMFAWAAPVKYENIVRSIRTSKHADETKGYLQNMYRYDNAYKFACQMCHDATGDIRATQLFNKPELELDPMNLCLCPNCAAKYVRIRNDEVLSKELETELFNLSESYIVEGEQVKIHIEDVELWFTQTHAAEIHELLVLLKTVRDCDKTVTGHSEPVDDQEAVDLYESCIKSKYEALIGKTVKYKTKDGYKQVVETVIVKAANSKLITLEFLTGSRIGKVIDVSIPHVEAGNLIEE